MKGRRFFFDAITTKPGTGFPFDVWYLNHYLPAMCAAGSWLGVRRYGSPSLGTHLAVFEASTGAAEINPVEARHDGVAGIERYFATQIGEQIAPAAGAAILEADFLYPVIFSVPAEREAEFDRWYDEEHLGILLECPYWPMCRRFKVIDPAPGSPTHIALHYLTICARSNPRSARGRGRRRGVTGGSRRLVSRHLPCLPSPRQAIAEGREAYGGKPWVSLCSFTAAEGGSR
jgi:hypothetical protein